MGCEKELQQVADCYLMCFPDVIPTNDEKTKKNEKENWRKIKKELLIPLRECQYLFEMKSDSDQREITRSNINFRLGDENFTQRPPYERDYTRILYSPSFRRLQGKMQMLAVRNDKFFRNRLTHSLEVSQIARSIAEHIGYDTDEVHVVEAGALAHDIGNPPFGHYGERVLNQLAKDIGGYEGNAQTLRILLKLEKKQGLIMV
jgi:dGTPase